MSDRVLYLGDTALNAAGAYLTGLMTDWGWDFEYIPSDWPLQMDRLSEPFGLYILSDYPAKHLTEDAQMTILDHVRAGAGLVMLGGWESFTGCDGHWGGTPIAAALPVEMSEHDDRVNCDRPALAIRTDTAHAISEGLPWEEHPPVVGGYNRFTARGGATELLRILHFNASRTGDDYRFEPGGTDPLLVVGNCGAGRTASLATDVAPHWIGPMVDWGLPRVSAEAPGAFAIEVGSHYARFFRQLLAWARQSD